MSSIIDSLAERGLTLNKKYDKLNTQTLVSVTCSNGHSYETEVKNLIRRSLKQNVGCVICSRKELEKLALSNANERLIQGHTIVSYEVKGKDRYYSITCAAGHTYEKRAVDIANGCPSCNNAINLGEERVRVIFNSLFNCEFTNQRPDWLLNDETGRNLELDGYNETIKIAFEYQGRQHATKNTAYSSDFENQIERDLKKKELCATRGVTIIEIKQPKSYQPKAFIQSVISDIQNQYTALNISQLKIKDLEKSILNIVDHSIQDKQSKAISYIEGKGYTFLSGSFTSYEDEILVQCGNKNCNPTKTTFNSFRQHYGAAYKSNTVSSEPCRSCKIEKNTSTRQNRTEEEFEADLLKNGWILKAGEQFTTQNKQYSVSCQTHPTNEVKAFGNHLLNARVSCTSCAKPRAIFSNIIKETAMRTIQTDESITALATSRKWTYQPSGTSPKLNDKALFSCPNGHSVEMPIRSFVETSRFTGCKECNAAQNKRAVADHSGERVQYNAKVLQEKAEAMGWSWTGTEYLWAKKPTTWACSEGHAVTVSPFSLFPKEPSTIEKCKTCADLKKRWGENYKDIVSPEKLQDIEFVKNSIALAKQHIEQKKNFKI